LPSVTMPDNLKQLYNYSTWLQQSEKTNIHPVYSLEEYNSAIIKYPMMNLVRISNDAIHTETFAQLEHSPSIVFVLETSRAHGMADQRQFFANIQMLGLANPVILKRSYLAHEFSGPTGDMMSVEEPISKVQLYSATDF